MDACPMEVFDEATGTIICLDKLPGPCATCNRVKPIRQTGIAFRMLQAMSAIYELLLPRDKLMSQRNARTMCR